LRALKYLGSDEARQAKQQLVTHVWNDLLTEKGYLGEQDPWELFKLIRTTGAE